MRLKETKDRRSGSRTLRITLGKGESIDYAMVEWIRSQPKNLLPDFRLSPDDERMFFYDITGMVALETLLKVRISPQQYHRLLVSVHELVDACAQAQIPAECVVWQSRHVYVGDADGGCPRYIVIPVRGAAVGKMTVLDLLRMLADGSRVRFPNESPRGDVDALRDFVRLNPVFSLRAYQSFLHGCGMDANGRFPDVGGIAQAGEPGRGKDGVEETSRRRNSGEVGNAVLDPVSILTGRAPTVGSDALMGVAYRGSADSSDREDAAHDLVPESSTGGTSGERVTPSAMDADSGQTEHVDVGQSVGRDVSRSNAQCTASSITVVRLRDGFSRTYQGHKATIGRSAVTDLQMRGDSGISRVHATIAILDDGGYDIADMHSSNGTVVNGRRLDPGGHMRIRPGEVFSLSDIEFVLR